MLTVRINEFEGYGLREFILFLEEAEDNIYEIVIPKDTTASSSCHDLAWEFFVGAYIGQQLSEISSEFRYKIAKPSHVGQFRFKITTVMNHKLANILLQISGAFGNSEKAKPIKFAREVNRFIANFKNKQAACQDMNDIANEYHSEIED